MTDIHTMQAYRGDAARSCMTTKSAHRKKWTSLSIFCCISWMKSTRGTRVLWHTSHDEILMWMRLRSQSQAGAALDAKVGLGGDGAGSQHQQTTSAAQALSVPVAGHRYHPPKSGVEYRYYLHSAVAYSSNNSTTAGVRGDTPEVSTLSPLKILWD